MATTVTPLGPAQAGSDEKPPDVVRLGSARGGWFRRAGLSHLVGILALIFSLFPILFVLSASLQPARHAELLGADSRTRSAWRTTRTCSRGRSRAGSSTA